MKAFFNLFLSGSLLVVSSCGQPGNSNEMASDTAYMLDANANRPAQIAPMTQYEETSGKQSSRVSVGNDTTGKQPHDGYPKQAGAAVKSDTTGNKASGRGIPIRPRD